MPVAASDVGHLDAGLHLLYHAVQRREPLLHEICPVAIAIEGCNAAGQARVVLAPSDAADGAARPCAAGRP